MGSYLLQSYVLELKHWILQVWDALDRDGFENQRNDLSCWAQFLCVLCSVFLPLIYQVVVNSNCWGSCWKWKNWTITRMLASARMRQRQFPVVLAPAGHLLVIRMYLDFPSSGCRSLKLFGAKREFSCEIASNSRGFHRNRARLEMFCWIFSHSFENRKWSVEKINSLRRKDK